MSTNKTQEIIKNIIYSLVWIIGYFTIYLALFGNSTIGGIPLLILTLPVPILFGLTKIWMNYLKKIQINKIVDFIKKIGIYISNSYRNSYNTPGKPKTVFWFQIYCQVLILISFLLLLHLFLGDFAGDYPLLTFSTVFGLVLCVPPLFLPRKHWVWIYNLTLLGISVTSLIFIPVAVPLIVLYSKPEVRKYYKS